MRGTTKLSPSQQIILGQFDRNEDVRNNRAEPRRPMEGNHTALVTPSKVEQVQLGKEAKPEVEGYPVGFAPGHNHNNTKSNRIACKDLTHN